GANAFRQSARQATNLIAQGLGGMLYALVGPAALLLLDGVSFLFAGAMELLVQALRRKTEYAMSGASSAMRRPRSAIMNDAAEGVRYVAAQPGMIGFLIAAA